MRDDYKVECGVHGTSPATFICHHLSHHRENQGFHMGYDPEDPDVLYPDAWCDQCNEVLEQEGEWNDTSEAFAKIKVVCANCYCSIRAKNWLQDEEALSHLIGDSFDYLQAMQDTFMKAYNIGDCERWDWDQEMGTLIFSHEGKPTVECDVHFVGTLSTLSKTWMWAWANQSLSDKVKEQSRLVRRIGDERQFLPLACPKWSADETDGWEMTAIMAKAVGAIGAYRTPDENGFVYMVVSKARWVSQEAEQINLEIPL